MTKPQSALAALRTVAAAVIARAFSAVVWFAILAVGGIGLLVAGIFLLWGLAWALVVCGGMAIVLAALLLIGMNRG